ncbi:MAG: LamG-like jellyroll fold domain-containing protein [Bauldia sp.]
MTLATGWSTANFWRSGTAAATAVPLSLACWFNVENTGVQQTLMGLFASASAANVASFTISVTTSLLINAATSGNAAISSPYAASPRVWNHAVGVFSAINARAAYLNGCNKGTNTTSNTPAGINRTSVGVSDASSALSPIGGAGLVALPAIWNVALTDGEVMALARGVSPLLIRPQALRFFSPGIVSRSLLVDRSAQRNNLTMQGSLRMTPEPRGLTDLLERPPAFDALPRLPTEVWQRPHNPNLMPHLRR